LKYFSLALMIVLILVELGTSGCSTRPLLYDVEFYPSVISPNADGHDDAANIRYKLSRNAHVSIYFVNQAGERYYHRNGERRSVQKEPYWTIFSGVVDVDEPGPVKRRMLPDGQYTWVIEATDDSGRTERVKGSLTIIDADTTLPELRGFSVSPQVFSPNRDGIDDHVIINYFLPKPATVRVYLESETGKKIFLPETVSQRIKPGEVGLHQYDYEGGVDLGVVPPPDGTYTVTAIAEDILGQRVEEHATLATLYFTATVENYGDTPVRTTGPEPGTIYTSRQNFSTLEWYQSDGAWRFGIDFEENPGYPYPFRWSLGRHEELEAVVKGEVEIVQNRVSPILITVDVPAEGPWNQ